MRNSLFAVALLGCTSLTTPAQAMPGVATFVSAVGAGLTGASATTAAVAAALGTTAQVGYVIGAGIAAIGGTVRGQLALGVGTTLLGNALFGGGAGSNFRPPTLSGPSPSQRLVNFSQPMTPLQTVYGRARVGGPVAFTGFTDGKRHYTVLVAAHRTQGPQVHYLDEREVTLDASNEVDTPPMAGYGSIRPFTGADGADAQLQAAFSEITSAHDFDGLSGAHLWAKRPPADEFTAVYPNGRQWAYLPVWRGHDYVYDPRTDSYGYTENAALIIAHWITETLNRDVDWEDLVATEADVCDETVTTLAGTENRWIIGGALQDSEDVETQRAKLGAACDAFFWEDTNGKVGFRVGRWIEPTITLTDDDFLSVNVTEGQWGADAVTEVQVRYIEPDYKWREAPLVWEIDSTSTRKRADVPLDLVHESNQASRIAKRLAKVKRPAYKLRGVLNLSGYEVIGERFVSINHAGLGISTTFEIDKLERSADGLTFALEAHSSEEADFDFDAATEELVPPERGEVVSDNDVTAPTGVTATSIGSDIIEVDWTPADASLTQQVRHTADSTGTAVIEDVPAGQRPYQITGLVDGETYDIELRNRTAALRPSTWKPDTPLSVTVVSNSTAPAAHTAFSTSLSGSDVTVNFTAPNDPNYYATRVYRGTTSTFADATLVRTEYGIPSNADSWTDTGLSAGTYYYWVAPINGSGVEGPATGPESETVT